MINLGEDILNVFDSLFLPVPGMEAVAGKEAIRVVNLAMNAMGNCQTCYGKGYVIDQDLATEAVKDSWETFSGKYELCTCKRGKMLKEVISEIHE